MPLKAGRMDRRVVVQQPVTVVDDYGEPEESWADKAVLWALIEPQPAGEHADGETIVTVRKIKATVRWFVGLDTTHRLVWDDLAWNITDLAEIGRREGWAITAEVVT